MEARADMSLALEKFFVPATGYPVSPERQQTDSRLNICVVFTSLEPTLAALHKAGVLASRLSARITLLVAQVVPFPLPLSSPPVLLDWNERRFQRIAAESPVETTVSIYLCRDQVETLTSVLSRHSLVVVGGGRRWWWPAAGKRLAWKLRRAGHEVIFTEME